MCGNLPGTQLEKLHQSAATCCRALVRNRLCDIAFQLFSQYRLQGAIFSEEGEKGKHFLEPMYQQRKRWLCSKVSDLSQNPYFREDTPCILLFYCSYSSLLLDGCPLNVSLKLALLPSAFILSLEISCNIARTRGAWFYQRGNAEVFCVFFGHSQIQWMSSCNGGEGVGGCFMPTASWGARQTQQLARFIAITDTMRILYCTERSTICPCSLGLRGWVGVGDGHRQMHRLHDVLQFFETSLKHRIVKK